jgi:alpha-L-fucosidase
MNYLPTLESIKSHPLPDWYNDAKFGIFIHWGIYSVPAFAPRGEMVAEKLIKGELGFAESPYAEWYQNSLRLKGSATAQYHAKTYGADFRYEQFAPMFNEQIQKWDPNSWAELFANAGARYVVLVSKHHDGFVLWNSRHKNPRIADWQASRDIAGELTQAVNARGMKMGFYYSSLLDWSFTQRPINSLAELIAGSDTSAEYLAYIEAHWRELIERYDPWILWSDIGYPPGYDLPKLWADFYNRKPEGVVNDRWMQLPAAMFNPLGRWVLGQMIKRMDPSKPPSVPHCDYVTTEYAGFETINPKKWEACRGIGSSFGYNQLESASNYLKAADIIRLLVDIVSKNGNLLLNVGPRADGSIHPSQVEALEGLGAWLKVNAEAIYATRPWKRAKDSCPMDGEVHYTAREGTLFTIVSKLPTDRQLVLPGADFKASFSLLETGETLRVEHGGEHTLVQLPADLPADSIPVLKTSI